MRYFLILITILFTSCDLNMYLDNTPMNISPYREDLDRMFQGHVGFERIYEGHLNNASGLYDTGLDKIVIDTEACRYDYWVKISIAHELIHRMQNRNGYVNEKDTHYYSAVILAYTSGCDTVEDQDGNIHVIKDYIQEWEEWRDNH